MNQVPKLSGWTIVKRQPVGMPGQRTLFDMESLEPEYVDPAGQQFLADFGHRLPGVDESKQQLLWDV